LTFYSQSVHLRFEAKKPFGCPGHGLRFANFGSSGSLTLEVTSLAPVSS